MNTLLLVDDDADFLTTMSELLTSRGYKVTCATDSLTATDLLNENRYDCLITDIVMPEFDGLELIMNAREQFPAMRVVAISGGGTIDKRTYLRMAHGLRADAVLEKPFFVNDLIAVIEGKEVQE